jgi:hypothetical protein
MDAFAPGVGIFNDSLSALIKAVPHEMYVILTTSGVSLS